MSWVCHVCGRERPDALIGVAKIDTSGDFDLPAGTMIQNVRYCIDRPECVAKAPRTPHFTRSV